MCQTAVCSGVPVACVGEGECSEEDREWEEASLCSSSTLLWSSALRISRSFRLWWTGTYDNIPYSQCVKSHSARRSNKSSS